MKIVFNVGESSFLSIPLTKELHQVITNRWRKAIKYGTDYGYLTKSEIVKAVRDVYYDMPKLRDETIKWVNKHYRSRIHR